jgi:hypothetical protein
MSAEGNQDGEGNADGDLSDEEIDRALSDFEAEFSSPSSPDSLPDSQSFEEIVSGESTSFDDELEGILGNKAKAALIVTSLTSAELLAAFCCLARVPALCIGSRKGAIAVLTGSDLEGDGPERRVKELTQTISGLSVALGVNRADKLQIHLWINGEAGDEIAPPLILASSAGFVEDVLIGAMGVEELKKDKHVIDSAAMDRDTVFKIIEKFTRHSR